MDPQELIKQAEQKASSSSGFFSKIMGSSSFQLEDAADLYIQAANAFRLRKDGVSAGKAFEKAASLQKQTDAKEEVANTLIEAYKAFRNDSPQDAARVLAESVHLFTLRGQFRRAAQYEMDLGELYENELDNADKAIQAYENAGDWYFNLDKYVEWDPTFAATKEYQFAKDFVDALKENDEQGFTDKLWEYDQFSKLDKWKVAMGLKIKQSIDAAEDDELL